MPISTFIGLETALRGHPRPAAALDVTGHNIANANTVGYTRQEAIDASPTSAPVVDAPGTGQLGTGVDVAALPARSATRSSTSSCRAQTMRQGYGRGAAGRARPGRARAQRARPTPASSSLLGKYWAPGRTSPTRPRTWPPARRSSQAAAQPRRRLQHRSLAS